MKRGLVLCNVLIVLGLLLTSGQAQYARKGVMIVDFDAQVTSWTPAREVATTRIIARLREDGTFRVLPRDRVQAALQEAKAETTGYLNVEDAQKVAKTLEADYVVMGVVDAFDQQQQGGCLPFVGCLYTFTATVGLRGKLLDVPTAAFVGEPRARVTKQQTGGSFAVPFGPWWTPVTVNNFDTQLIGKAAQEAIDQFVADLKKYLKP